MKAGANWEAVNEIKRRLAQGQAVTRIADDLSLSRRCVESYVTKPVAPKKVAKKKVAPKKSEARQVSSFK